MPRPLVSILPQYPTSLLLFYPYICNLLNEIVPNRSLPLLLLARGGYYINTKLKIKSS
jgi:hypothetical protein